MGRGGMGPYISKGRKAGYLSIIVYLAIGLNGH